jgi:hypothetical protein
MSVSGNNTRLPATTNQPNETTAQKVISAIRLFHQASLRSARRNQARRFQLLEQYDFDPFTDLTLDRQGAWRWATDKQEMNDFVNQYFQLRAEDTV